MAWMEGQDMNGHKIMIIYYLYSAIGIPLHYSFARKK